MSLLQRRARANIYGLMPFSGQVDVPSPQHLNLTSKRRHSHKQDQPNASVSVLDRDPDTYDDSDLDYLLELSTRVSGWKGNEVRRVWELIGGDHDANGDDGDDESEREIEREDVEMEDVQVREGQERIQEEDAIVIVEEYDDDEEEGSDTDGKNRSRDSESNSSSSRSVKRGRLRRWPGRRSQSRTRICLQRTFEVVEKVSYFCIFGIGVALLYVLVSLPFLILGSLARLFGWSCCGHTRHKCLCWALGISLLQLAGFYLWPFGKFIERRKERFRQPPQMDVPLAISNSRFLSSFCCVLLCCCSSIRQLKWLCCGDGVEADLGLDVGLERMRLVGEEEEDVNGAERVWSGISLVIYWIFAVPVLGITHLWSALVGWFGVVTITVAKLHWNGFRVVMVNPLRFRVNTEFPPSPGSDIFLCIFQAVRLPYLRYSVYGMNILLVNSLPIVLVTLVLGLCFGQSFTDEFALLIFLLSLYSMLPLSYLASKAMSSLSAQSSFALGAFLNALFGGMNELILYFIVLSKKGLELMVHRAFTGSLLGVLLLLPGLSMFAGGLRHKQQYFLKSAAGVSAVLLFLACGGAFVPTLFYEVYGSTHFTCDLCTQNFTSSGFDCSGCYYYEKNYVYDPVFHSQAKPLIWVCAVILPVAYVAGLVFTLMTHKDLYDKPITTDEGKDKEVGAAVSAQWSRVLSLIILLVCTFLFAGISFVVARTVEPGLNTIFLEVQFAGVSLIALAPHFAEFVSAVQFALQDNIILSLEIGNVAALQKLLLQTSALVIFSQILYGWILKFEEGLFYLLFPQMDLYALLFSVVILNYIMIDRRTNYFRGIVLILVYCIIMSAYFIEFNF